MAAAGEEFAAYCAELLGAAGTVSRRRMFGGVGFYLDGIFIALIAAERLYLKVDAESRSTFEVAGCVPFVYDAAGASVTMGYFSAPDEAMESPHSMRPWALQALSAALRARAPKPRAAAPARKAMPRSGSTAKAPKKL